MSFIRLECGNCHTFLQVRAELAGQQGRCPKCGATVAIPPPPPGSDAPTVIMRTPSPPAESQSARPPEAQPSLPLSRATAPDMLAEIARRKKSAVLVVFETPTDGSYDLGRRNDANVRCYPTPDMNDAQLMQVLDEVGRMSQGQRNQKGGVKLQPDVDDVLFELKGDRLGMTLAEFKSKHARKIGGMTMPYCSDGSPGQANPTLWIEPWHAAAGIVHGRLELPSEGNSPTVAGVKSELFLYHFVDGRLFRMTVLFDTEAFHLVREALVQKRGTPTSELKDPLEIAWSNDASTIRPTRGTMRPKKLSSLLLIHHELQLLADNRIPKRGDDL